MLPTSPGRCSCNNRVRSGKSCEEKKKLAFDIVGHIPMRGGRDPTAKRLASRRLFNACRTRVRSSCQLNRLARNHLWPIARLTIRFQLWLAKTASSTNLEEG